ncbi:uncharacterized protein LOC111288644 isoform X2 [Durio zibethinus]|uniref:Uncharacterized protein LOC111288644 isoform X2 n=1 Tax=Durio zibethinus TaxID=66656 RepID=A0A6P5Y4K9_DURZI|nr:uncharacterized protein LOC111288644 isoform X2 [Durio zibethinus]
MSLEACSRIVVEPLQWKQSRNFLLVMDNTEKVEELKMRSIPILLSPYPSCFPFSFPCLSLSLSLRGLRIICQFNTLQMPLPPSVYQRLTSSSTLMNLALALPYHKICYDEMPLQELQATQEQQTIQNLHTIKERNNQPELGCGYPLILRSEFFGGDLSQKSEKPSNAAIRENAALPPTTNMKTSKKKKTLISMKQLKMTGGKKRMKSSSPRLVMEGMVVEFYCKVFLRYAFSSIEELESYSQEYKKRLDEPGEGREIPDDLAL